MQDNPMTFDYEFFAALKRREDKLLLDNPSIKQNKEEYAKSMRQLSDLARNEVRNSVYQDTLRDLMNAGVAGVRKNEKLQLTASSDTDRSQYAQAQNPLILAQVIGEQPQTDEYVADPDSDAHEFAVLRQNQYESGQPMRYWDEYVKSKPSKLAAASTGFIASATLAFEGAAESLGRYVGTAGFDLIEPYTEYADKLGVSPTQLARIIGKAENQIGARAMFGDLTEQERRVYDTYMQLRQPLMEDTREEVGKTFRSAARGVVDVALPYVGQRVRDAIIGQDPNAPMDIRETVGRGGGGSLVKTAEMAGAAVGIIPYSLPALATRNPKVALALTSPFYAMGHSEAWDRRMRIYEEQAAEARQLGLPMPARPGFTELAQQSAIGGGIELASEYTIDRIQVSLPHLANWSARKLPRAAGSATMVKEAGDAVLESMSRRRGLLGVAKGAAVLSAGAVTEAVEEAIPQLGKEIIDPLFIPKGYESRFFSEETAEAMGTGAIAGFLMTGGQVAFGSEARQARRERKKFSKSVDTGRQTVVGAIADKASRVATQRFAANAIAARGSTMAAHQVEELMSGRRNAMLVSPENSDATLTEDVLEKMRGLGIDKPIGQLNGFDVYAMPAMADDVRSAISSSDTQFLTGYPQLMDPSLPMIGAFVVRNKANQIVDVIPYSNEADAESALGAVTHVASLGSNRVEVVNGDGLASVSEAIELQADGDAEIRKLIPPSKRPQSTERKGRGINALRASLESSARTSAGKGDDAPFNTPMLTREQIGDATNADVTTEVSLTEVPESSLSEGERRVASATGVKPTILDATVKFKIKRPDGRIDEYESDGMNSGAYLEQQSPDGIFLIREKGKVFTAKNAFIVALHELRHRMVGKSRGAAAYLSRLLYLDPAFAMRGGVEYMRSYEAMDSESTDAALLSTMDDASMIVYYSAMHNAAMSVLSDSKGYSDAVKTMRDPNATEEQVKVAEARIAEQKIASEQLSKVERFAEESLATASERALGNVATEAMNWETVYKDARNLSARKWISWLSHVLARNGFAGPEARQALYEVKQRMQGMDDAELRIHDQMRESVEKAYREDLLKHEEAKQDAQEGARQAAMIVGGAGAPASQAQQMPAPEAVQAPTGQAQPVEAQEQKPLFSLRAGAPTSKPGVVGMDEEDDVASATALLQSSQNLPAGERANAVANAVSMLVKALPMLSMTQANLAGTQSSRAGTATGLRFPGGFPERQPVEAAGTAPQPTQAMTQAERNIIERDRSKPLFSIRSGKAELYSALSRGIKGVPEKSLTPESWKQRLKSMVNKGEVKQAEIEWSGLTDYIDLFKGKISRAELESYLKQDGVRIEPLVAEVDTSGLEEKALDEVRDTLIDRAGRDASDELFELLDGYFDDVPSEERTVDDVFNIAPEVEGLFTREETESLIRATGIQRTRTRQKLLNRMRERGVGFSLPDDLSDAFDILKDPGASATAKTDARAKIDDAAWEAGIRGIDEIRDEMLEIRQENEAWQTKYAEYTLPGGTRYNETILTLPTPDFDLSEMQTVFDEEYQRASDEEKKAINDAIPGGYSRQAGFSADDLRSLDIPFVRDYLKNYDRFFKREESSYESGHWEDVPNPIAHIRTKDRMTPDGKKILFVEELQSDWAQAGRRKGFKSVARMAEIDREYEKAAQEEKDAREAAKNAISKIHDMTNWYYVSDVLAKTPDWRTRNTIRLVGSKSLNINRLTELEKDAIDRHVNAKNKMASLGDERASQNRLISPAPFVESTDGWLNLSLKSVILRAINDGYDGVAFVNGQQSADRYSLTKTVNSIEYQKVDDGYELRVRPVGSEDYVQAGLPRVIEEEQLADYVGQEIAEKIRQGKGERSTEDPVTYLDANDLKVGGKGMQEFYDRVVPAAVGKLLKKVGGSPTQLEIANIDNQRMLRQPGFLIDDKMVDSVEKAGGLPMFSTRKRVRESSGKRRAPAFAFSDDFKTLLGSASIDAMKPIANREKWKNIRDLKEEMQGVVLESARRDGIDLAATDSEKTKRYLVEIGVKDALTALDQQKGAIGWYDLKTRIALRVMSLIHPEIATDQNSRFAFIFALAVTSNGNEVSVNFKLADKAYRAWKQTGKMPTDIGTGIPADQINRAMQRFNVLSPAWGLDDFRKFMLSEFTVGEIGKLSDQLTPGGEFAATTVRGAAILGPKIGNGFFSNLYGIFDSLTMDRWLVRTWGRWSGSLIEIDEQAVSRGRVRMSAALKGLSDEQKKVVADAADLESIDGKTPDEIANAISRRMSDKERRTAFDSNATNSEIRRAANGLRKSLDGSKEMPSGPGERNLIREIFGRILEEVRKNPSYKDLTMADLQAVLWYAEKRLYETAKEDSSESDSYEPDSAPDYANAAIEVARSTGVPDTEIQQAKDDESGRTAVSRRGDGEEGAADIAAIKSSIPQGFTPKERRAFTGSQVAANLHEKRSGATSGSWSYAEPKRLGLRSPGRSRDVTSESRTETVSVAATLSPGHLAKKYYTTFGHSYPAYLELEQGAGSAEAFSRFLEDARRSQKKFGAAVYVYPESEYASMRLFVSEDGMSGFAIKPDGDIVSVFNNSGSVKPDGLFHSAGRSAVEAAVAAGGRKLDCFDTVLPRFYAAHGFVETSRVTWDDAQAPADWDYGTFSAFNNGRPDVVMMVYDPEAPFYGDRKQAPSTSDYGDALTRQERMKNEIASRGIGKTVDAQFSMRRGARGLKDEAVLRYLDRYDELRRYVDIASNRGAALPPILNPYIGARLLTGRLGAIQQQAERRYADILRRMHVAGVSLGQMDEFLTAQHARERNEYVASINPAFPDGGSGMLSVDADNIIQRARNAGTYATLDGFAEEWRQMLRNALDERLASGLITQETYDTLTTRYKKYVPLRGAPAQINDEDFMDFAEEGGRGLSTTGQGIPRAMGRRSTAESVTSQVGFVHEDTLRRIERNRIGQGFLALTLALRDRNAAEVVPPRRRAIVNGTVREIHDPLWSSDPRNFGVYIDRPMNINGRAYQPGSLVVIRINNRRLAEAMTQPTLELRNFELALRHVNNAWRFMTTGLGNPTFGPVNLIRDLGTATLNNLAQRGALDTLGMLGNWPGAFRNVFIDAWSGRAPTRDYADFINAGGDQLYWRPNDIEIKRVDFDDLARRVQRRDPRDRTIARTLLGWYPAFFTAAETASRVAQYRQRISTGSSAQEAALAARDITVDFAKGGQAKPVLNTWYMFLNAGLQGSVNTLRALTRSIALAPSLMMLGFVNAAMGRFIGGDDEETGQSNWDNIPEYEKTANLFFFDPMGSGKHIKIPLPYGYNVFVSMGARIADAIYGRATASDVLTGSMMDAMNSFNPIGGSGITSGGTALVSAAVPTMARPAIELLGNQNFSGRPIYPTTYERFAAPDSQSAFDGTPPAYSNFASFVNGMTGGDEFESGMIDVSPNTLEYLVGYYFSGTGRNLDRLAKTLFSAEDVSISDVPLARSFVGDAANDVRTFSQTFNAMAAEAAPTLRRLDALEDAGRTEEEKMSIGRSMSAEDIELANIVSSTEDELRQVRRALREATPEQRDAILEIRRRIIKGAIKAKNELTDANRPL